MKESSGRIRISPVITCCKIQHEKHQNAGSIAASQLQSLPGFGHGLLSVWSFRCSPRVPVGSLRVPRFLSVLPEINIVLFCGFQYEHISLKALYKRVFSFSADFLSRRDLKIASPKLPLLSDCPFTKRRRSRSIRPAPTSCFGGHYVDATDNGVRFKSTSRGTLI